MSALCQIGNNNGKSLNYPVVTLSERIQPGGPVSLEHSDFEGQQENSGKQDEEEDGILEYNSTSDDGTFHLWSERLILSSEEVPASEDVFASTTDLCCVNFSLFTLLWNNGIAVTFCLSCIC